jgi:1-deoxy-D-xylulose-5-phosphate synthase
MILERINSPSDLKRLSEEDLPILAQEIREKIIEVVSKTGGHLASSLGAVEIAIALHYCLDTPSDKIIWDVGHQAYAHKILTQRRDRFSTLRQFGGLSGFPSSSESVYDPFTIGHSSTAVSLALGMASARDICGSREKIVAVIGDGSLSGGLCFEGLNNAGHLNLDLLVILNTNEMSISPVVGALSNYLNKIISLPIYNRFRSNLENFIKTRIPRGSRLLKLADRFEEGLKGLFVPGIFFEELGFRYFGPLDGHNLAILIPTLKNLLTLRGPILLHVVTKKGKGYAFAERFPERFHSAAPFEIRTGQLSAQELRAKTYTQVFSQKLVELAKIDRRIVVITAAMPQGTGLDKFADSFPERFFDVGIAEEHAVVFASGLAKRGLKPVVAIYSTFLQRSYDQIIEEIGLQNLPVILAIDRAGLIGEDGATHQGLFDLSFLRHIPNLVIIAPKDGEELKDMLEFAVNYKGPIALRYPKGEIPITNYQLSITKLELGKAEVLREGEEIAIIALGSMVYPSLEAAEKLSKEKLNVSVINARFVKPLDEELFRQICPKVKRFFTVEEGTRDGGFGSGVLEKLILTSSKVPRVHIIALPNEFIEHGKRELLLERYGLTAEGIAKTIMQNAKGKD